MRCYLCGDWVAREALPTMTSVTLRQTKKVLCCFSIACVIFVDDFPTLEYLHRLLQVVAFDQISPAIDSFELFRAIELKM